MKRLVLFGMVMISLNMFSQENESLANMNSAEKMLNANGDLIIGGYGEVHYNQMLEGGTRHNGNLDVHRMVMLIGYHFNERTRFVTEIEYEHVKEVYIEQAFLQYKINNHLNFRGGLILTPMGIINEYHEPTTFHGVERPLIDNVMAPTTWREIGFGFAGNVLSANTKYQVYLVNGFNGYDGDGKLGGKSGLRGGRQKGAESFISTPNITGKIEYYGIKGLNIGISGYIGKTQSTLFNKLDKADNEMVAMADSSVIGVSMIGLDGRYTMGALQLKGQLYYSALSNSDEYNQFAETDLGSSMLGYYTEVGYNIFSLSSLKTELIPFVRLSQYNLHQTVDESISANPAYNNLILTTGISWKLDKGAVIKSDLQLVKSEADDAFTKVFSLGFGVMF